MPHSEATMSPHWIRLSPFTKLTTKLQYLAWVVFSLPLFFVCFTNIFFILFIVIVVNAVIAAVTILIIANAIIIVVIIIIIIVILLLSLI